MRILGIDPSTKAIGWALLETDGDRLIDSGVYHPKGDDFDALLSNAHRWLHLLLHSPLCQDVRTLALELAVYHRNVKTLRTLAQMAGALRVAAHPHVDRVVEILPGERRVALGIPIRMKSKPAKQAIIGIVNARYGLGLGPKDDDQADAVAVAVAAARKLAQEEKVE